MLTAILIATVLVASYAASTTRIPAAPRSAGDRNEYSFFGLSARGAPFRWDPCTAIRYQVDLAGKPSSALRDIREAVRRTAAASGLRFEFVGLVEDSSPRTILRDRRFVLPRVGGRPEWSPVLVTFATRQELRCIGGADDAIALAFPIRSTGDRDQFVSGLIVVNSDAALVSGFASIDSLGPVVEHEFGHIVGLGHADQWFQLMYPYPIVNGWNDGDLTGLRRLGSGPCLVVPPASTASPILP